MQEDKPINQNANLTVTVIIIYNQKQTVYLRVYELDTNQWLTGIYITTELK